MNVKVKLGAYVVLIALTAWFGHGFYSRFHANGSPSPAVKAVSHHKKKKPKTAMVAAGANTNVAASETNISATDTNAASGDTNLAAAATSDSGQNTNSADSTAGSNVVAQAGNADTNAAATAPAPTKAGADDDGTVPDHEVISGAPQGSTVTYLALFVLSVIGLGLMIAYDLTHAVGAKAGDYLFDNAADRARDPEYEKAEQAWADGNHLEAIQMLRDYYKRNPREVHAALRIAEIYEKDLKNYLAAALEYDEVLKKKLPPERWAWAAIHLCNLHSRLGQQEKTMALLQRIANEYPQTAAAKKARQKLGLPEPDEAPATANAAAGKGEEEAAYDVETSKGEWQGETTEEAPTDDSPKSNLPRGFRPKK